MYIYIYLYWYIQYTWMSCCTMDPSKFLYCLLWRIVGVIESPIWQVQWLFRPTSVNPVPSANIENFQSRCRSLRLRPTQTLRLATPTVHMFLHSPESDFQRCFKAVYKHCQTFLVNPLPAFAMRSSWIWCCHSNKRCRSIPPPPHQQANTKQTKDLDILILRTLFQLQEKEQKAKQASGLLHPLRLSHSHSSMYPRILRISYHASRDVQNYIWKPCRLSMEPGRWDSRVAGSWWGGLSCDRTATYPSSQ